MKNIGHKLLQSKTPEKEKSDCQKQNDERKPKRYNPMPGHVWNPFTNFPPNYKCFCDSGKKFKKCCEPKMSRTIPANQELAMKNKYRIDMIKSAQISGKK